MNILDLFQDWETRETFASGETVFAELQEGDTMYIVLEGEVELTKQGEPLGAEPPGGIIGEMAIIGSGSPLRSATATAIQKSTLAKINRGQFVELIRQEPEFAIHIMQVLANRLKVAHMLRMS